MWLDERMENFYPMLTENVVIRCANISTVKLNYNLWCVFARATHFPLVVRQLFWMRYGFSTTPRSRVYLFSFSGIKFVVVVALFFFLGEWHRYVTCQRSEALSDRWIYNIVIILITCVGCHCLFFFTSDSMTKFNFWSVFTCRLTSSNFIWYFIADCTRI